MKTEAVRLAELSHRSRISEREWSSAICKARDAEVTNLDFLHARLEVTLPLDSWGNSKESSAARRG